MPHTETQTPGIKSQNSRQTSRLTTTRAPGFFECNSGLQYMNGARGNAWNIGGGDPVVLKGELPRVQPPSSPAFSQMPTMSSSETKGARARPYRRVLQLSEEASVLHTQVVAECFFFVIHSSSLVCRADLQALLSQRRSSYKPTATTGTTIPLIFLHQAKMPQNAFGWTNPRKARVPMWFRDSGILVGGLVKCKALL